MSARFQVFESSARSILTPTSGFIREAGFTHSLSPARNCTFACTYCYVPTMRIYAGLKPDDWKRWGQFTTFKSNAAQLLARELRPDRTVYCSPLVDPYQPAEESQQSMPAILEAVIANPPEVFVVQTRGPLILRDILLLQRLAAVTTVRVSFSLTTDWEDVRRLYEPHCATFQERLDTIATLRAAGIETYATLAPLLPSSIEAFAQAALDVSGRDLIGDPLHVRSVKPHGATTREAAHRIGELHGHTAWFQPDFQNEIIDRIDAVARVAGRRFATGPEGFSWLAQTN